MIPGSAFGRSGVGFVRASYATSCENIERALERIGRFMQRHGEKLPSVSTANHSA
jgi:aminotransferase